MKMNYSIPIAIFIIGLVIFVLSFFSPVLELKIALILAGAAFILSGVIQLGQAQDKKQDDRRFEQIMSKLNEIQQELEKVEQPKGTGVVIADVITSGLKYYTEQMTRPKEEEEND